MFYCYYYTVYVNKFSDLPLSENDDNNDDDYNNQQQ